MEAGPVDFDSHLAETWAAYFEKSKEDSETSVYHTSSKFRQAEDGPIPLTVFYNKRHDVSRFFEKSAVDEEEAGSNDSLDLDDDLNVFKKESVGADLIKANEDKILFFVDLENETVVPGGQEAKETDMEESLDASTHPVLINQFPLGENHSILLLFAQEGLPQILSDEILALIFQIFRLSSAPDLRLGYNSMGAECWINNLHCHLLSTSKVFGEGKVFPIESAATETFLKSTLKHKAEDEINMFSIGVEFAVTTDWPIKAFVVRPLASTEEKEDSGLGALEGGSEPTDSVAHAVGVILNMLIDGNTPHNILVSDRGETVYVIPRKFDMLINAAHFSTEFNDLCGLLKCKDEKSYDSITWEQYAKFLKREVALDDDAFLKLQKNLVGKFYQEYECTE
jgi:hypothetical protein